jgi:hypothetical protein
VCVWCSNFSCMRNHIVRNKTDYLTIFHTIGWVVSNLPAVKKLNSFFCLYLIKLLSYEYAHISVIEFTFILSNHLTAETSYPGFCLSALSI